MSQQVLIVSPVFDPSRNFLSSTTWWSQCDVTQGPVETSNPSHLKNYSAINYKSLNISQSEMIQSEIDAGNVVFIETIFYEI